MADKPLDSHQNIGNNIKLFRLIKKYFDQNYMYSEICGILEAKHGVKISLKTLKRKLKKLNLKRKNFEENIPKITKVLHQEINGRGCNVGYRFMWRRLQTDYGLRVKQKTVLRLMNLIDPNGIEERSRYRLKRRQYQCCGPNYLWHIDGHDKLKRYGFAIHGCVDGFSKKVLWLNVGMTNNNPLVIANYFLKTVLHYGVVPMIVRADKGTENKTVEKLQKVLRNDHVDDMAGEKSFIYGKSTANQRIERHWSMLRQHTLDFYINIFKVMEAKQILDISNPLHIDLLRFCFGQLIQNSLSLHKKEWNNHRIRRQNNRNVLGGIPNIHYYWPEKYDGVQCGQSIDKHAVQRLLQKFSTESILYSPLIYKLVKILIPDVENPKDCKEAYNLFVNLSNNPKMKL